MFERLKELLGAEGVRPNKVQVDLIALRRKLRTIEGLSDPERAFLVAAIDQTITFDKLG